MIFSVIYSHRVERDVTSDDLKIFGFRIESSNNEIEYHDGGVPSVLKDSEFTMRIFGKGITPDTVITACPRYTSFRYSSRIRSLL